MVRTRFKDSLMLNIQRRFSTAGTSPEGAFSWESRTARLIDWRTGNVSFERHNVEVPESWSVNATNILASKYLRDGAGYSESSLQTAAHRIVDKLAATGVTKGMFTEAEASIFADELLVMVYAQMFSWNSPVWFNIGVPGRAQTPSACFILGVEDSITSILDWYKDEAVIFKAGSGAGINLSKIRSSLEALRAGGVASGPVTFMRGADASAGTIKSGGVTRRAAKLVCLNVDHPDIEEFIDCKVIEEDKIRALRDAGFDMDLGGQDSFSVQYQNANNSIRISDAFMEAVEADEDWHLRAVTTGEIVKTLKARFLWEKIASAAWKCADPGVIFDTTVNRWHTVPNAGVIESANPCVEFHHLTWSSCNLASVNVLKFLSDDGAFDVDGFEHACRLIAVSMELLIEQGEYPIEKIADVTRKFRPLGLGLCNLGAALMAQGLAYDSEKGRQWSAALMSLLTGSAYASSVDMAEVVGPFEGFAADRNNFLRVLGMHEAALYERVTSQFPSTTDIVCRAKAVWEKVNRGAEVYGVRNSQGSVNAPTGTISFLMDADTTGIEPDLGLRKTKKMVGGGSMTIANQSVGRALAFLAFSKDQVADVEAHIVATGSVTSAPWLSDEDKKVFACSMGDGAIAPRGHVKMLAALQPHISGSSSKTVNLPADTTVEDIQEVYFEAWRTGVKAVAVYRDNCKVGQPLEVASTVKETPAVKAAVAVPGRRSAMVTAFNVGGMNGELSAQHVGGELVGVKMSAGTTGTTLNGLLASWSDMVTLALNSGATLSDIVKAGLEVAFEPRGMTNDADLRISASLIDYAVRRLALDFLTVDERFAIGVQSSSERAAYVAESDVKPVEHIPVAVAASAPLCGTCGALTIRAGSCFACQECGSTTGCG
jgi:ribonucleoside-diphosphate reductase alpha chain